MNDREFGLSDRTLSGAGFLLIGATSIQWTAAIVIRVFPLIGPAATSAWRFLFGALALVALTRPKVRHWTRRQWLGALALGLATAFMNQCFYQAIERIPLGSAVAIEFLGPFCVAALGRRSPRHFALVVLAGLGVVALTRPGNGLNLDRRALRGWRRRSAGRATSSRRIASPARRRVCKDSRCRCRSRRSSPCP